MPSFADLLEKDKAKNQAILGRPEQVTPTPTDKTVSKIVRQPRVFEVRHTLPLPSDLIDYLEGLAKSINRQRSPSNRKVRVTTNTVIRAWLSSLKGRNFNLSEVKDEADLTERLRKNL